jgi:hypothetical protein
MLAGSNSCRQAAMALFEWHTNLRSDNLQSELRNGIESLGLVVDESATSHAQLFACDPHDQGIHYAERVSVIAAWTNQRSGEVKIEVRSQEPLLRKQTRCQTLAAALQQLFPDLRTA